MYPNFNGLPEEKRRKIIDACMEEFACNGYEKASTNAIINRAGISKGILFHYFGNKKNLYLYIFDYAVEHLMNRFYSADIAHTSDIFERYMVWGKKKIRIAYDEPLIYSMLVKAVLDPPNELKEEIQTRYERVYREGLDFFLKDMDTSKFRKGINADRAVELLALTVEALGNKYIRMFKDEPDRGMEEMEGIMDEVGEYLDILKHGICER